MQSEGRVKICVEGFWRTVSDMYSWWRREEATVVCRQLGMKSSGVFIRRTQMVTACNNVICTTLYCVILRGSFSW